MFTRPDPASPFREFRGVMEVRSNLSAFVALFFDFDAYPLWIHNCGPTRILKRSSEDEIYVHTVTRTPWFLSDRDNILRVRFRQDPSTFVITIRMKGMPTLREKLDRYVRIRKFEGFWRLVPDGNGKVRVIYQARLDPGGDIPPFLSNWFVHVFPFHTLAGLRKLVSSPRYQSVRLPQVREPVLAVRHREEPETPR